MESSLNRELQEYKEEICRQMDLTEKLTNQFKGNKKTYLDAENALIIKANKESEEKPDQDNKEKGNPNAEDGIEKIHDEISDVPMMVENTEIVTSTLEQTSDKAQTKTQEEDNGKSKELIAKLKVPLTQKILTADELRRKSLIIRDDDRDESRMTRLKSSQIASGTYLFKLGMENTFKLYVNQFTTNIIALNKPQRNEERDKKRHLSHKFSLTPASEFKWVGAVSGTRSLLINTLRHTILQLEQQIPSPFMHTNWHLLRKHWLAIVGNCQQPKDFARALVVLQACIKPVVFANVWHEQLGHTKLARITATDREERKKIEKREKKERDEEEERNRMIISGYVKYTMSFKHQLWKQKGEEYRIHGRWGWLWIRTPRNFHHNDSRKLGLSAPPQKNMVQVRDSNGNKVLALDSHMYNFLLLKLKGDKNDEEIPEVIRKFEIVPPITKFEEIDVSKALLTPGRLLYPKVAKKSKLDNLLSRRVQLKVLEERKIAQAKPEDVQKEDDVIEIEDEENSNEGLDKQITNMMSGKVSLPNSAAQVNVADREILNSYTKRIHALRTQYTSIAKLAKDFQCYVKGCNSSAGSTLETSCYSPLCMRRVKVRKDLLTLLRKANLATNSLVKLPTQAVGNGTPVKKTSILEQTLKSPQVSLTPKEKDLPPTKETICKELVNVIMNAPKMEDESNVYVPAKVKEEIKSEIKEEVKQEPQDNNISSPLRKKIKRETDEDEEIDVHTMSPDAIKEMILGGGGSGVKNEVTVTSTVTTTTTVTTSQTMVDGVVKSFTTSENTADTVTVSSTIAGSTRTIQTLNANKSTIYSAQQNRRFCAYKVGVKREEKVVKAEQAEDGSTRIYSALSTEGKMVLKKIPNSIDIKRKKRHIVKYPAVSTFRSSKGAVSLLVLPQHDARKLARNAGRIQITGYHTLAKPNYAVWPYPCARPLFKTCWVYRTVNLKSLSAAALQLKILWACLRWDDMQTKPPNTDGKHQITTETEILSLELLKHRHVGQFLEKTQYLRRKVVIPLGLPKTVRGKFSLKCINTEFLI